MPLANVRKINGASNGNGNGVSERREVVVAPQRRVHKHAVGGHDDAQALPRPTPEPLKAPLSGTKNSATTKSGPAMWSTEMLPTPAASAGGKERAGPAHR